MAGPKPVEGVLPGTISQFFMNEDFGGIGNWFPVVNGVLIPCENVNFNLPQPTYAEVKNDARLLPIAKYPQIGQEYYVELDVPTTQPQIEAALRGLTLLPRTTVNTNRQVGTLAVALATADAEWFALKINISGDVFEIPRLDYVNPDLTTFILSWYNSVGQVCQDPALISGHTFTYSYPLDNSRYLGNIHATRTHNAFAAGDTFTYDANTPIKVTFGTDSLVIDNKHIDPNLKTGDTAIILGATYKWGQIATANVDSYSWLYKLYQSRQDMPLEFWMPLGKSATSLRFRHRTIHRAQLTNIPDFGATTGKANAANMMKYRFDIIQFTGQNATAAVNVSDLYEEEVIELPAA